MPLDSCRVRYRTVGKLITIYFLRWRILARMRRFFRPILRLPLPVFLVPTQSSERINKFDKFREPIRVSKKLLVEKARYQEEFRCTESFTSVSSAFGSCGLWI
jgi:hypothetical protein